jgi:hypothetical protein
MDIILLDNISNAVNNVIKTGVEHVACRAHLIREIYIQKIISLFKLKLLFSNFVVKEK